MAEQKVYVETYEVSYACDKCGVNLESRGEKHIAGFLGQPESVMKYKYGCPGCGADYWLDKVYPFLAYEVVRELT
jgi:uncharacterized protein with PIN domain